MLATELLADNASTRAEEPRQLLARAVSYLPEGHGPVSARFDCGFYRTCLRADYRARGVRFSISVARTQAIWRALERVADDTWQPAEGLRDAEVAETTSAPEGWQHEALRLLIRRVAHQADALSDDPRARRRATIRKDQLNLALGGELDVIYGYRFILTDREGEGAAVERQHRERAQIEERIKDHKLGVSLRRLPLSDLDANRFWLHRTALALNLLALLSDLLFGSDPPGHHPRRPQASGCDRRLRLRLPAGPRSAPALAAAYATAHSRRSA